MIEARRAIWEIPIYHALQGIKHDSWSHTCKNLKAKISLMFRQRNDQDQLAK